MPEISIYDLSFYQGLVSKFSFLLEATLKRKISPKYHDEFLCYYGKSDEIQRLLNIKNIILGYAYLVDKNGFIRWTAHASPTEGEIQALLNLTQRLNSATDVHTTLNKSN